MAILARVADFRSLLAADSTTPVGTGGDGVMAGMEETGDITARFIVQYPLYPLSLFMVTAGRFTADGVVAAGKLQLITETNRYLVSAKFLEPPKNGCG